MTATPNKGNAPMNASSKIDAKHTPGPWKVFRTTDGRQILGIGEASNAGGVTDAKFGLWRDGEEAEANAYLIAAAPELLDICKRQREELRLIRMKDCDAVYDATLRTGADIAIAKAEGR